MHSHTLARKQRRNRERQDTLSQISRLFHVHDYYGLTEPRPVDAHGAHLIQNGITQIKKTKSVISFCPISNFFPRSGLFPYRALKDKDARIALGTDAGAGTSFSLLETLNEAYKGNQLNQTRIWRLKGHTQPPWEGQKPKRQDLGRKVKRRTT